MASRSFGMGRYVGSTAVEPVHRQATPGSRAPARARPLTEGKSRHGWIESQLEQPCQRMGRSRCDATTSYRAWWATQRGV